MPRRERVASLRLVRTIIYDGTRDFVCAYWVGVGRSIRNMCIVSLHSVQDYITRLVLISFWLRLAVGVQNSSYLQDNVGSTARQYAEVYSDIKLARHD